MRRGRMKGAGFVLLVVLALVASIIPASAEEEVAVPEGLTADSAKSFSDGTYVVIFDGAPVVAYDGDIKGLPATKPKPGQKVNPNSAKVIKYQDHLIARHDKALANVGVGQAKKLYSYTMVLDGAAADLKAAQAEALAVSDGVLAVVPEAIHQLDTISTAEFLGLTAENGAWDQGHVGEDVIVGIIDSGIWPEHPSVSDRTGENKKGKSGKLDYQQIPGWHGKCTPGEDFPASLCNHKLIAAQRCCSTTPA